MSDDVASDGSTSRADRPSAAAFVPARAGSSRVPDKNVRELAGHPLIAYTIAAARASGMFDAVIVSTDDERYAAIARDYGAEVPFLRPAELATTDSPDIAWLDHLLRRLAEDGRAFDVFSILRPTSPLRTAATIVRAMEHFLRHPEADSLRAVEPVVQHPGKMWTIDGELLVPVMPGMRDGVPFHSSATQYLPEVWVQNASLEIAHTRCVLDHGSIAGEKVLAFVNPEPEGFDVNHAGDWDRLVRMVDADPSLLPDVDVEDLHDRPRALAEESDIG